MKKISKQDFEKEMEMCRKLSQKNGKRCNWGECDKCGVIPLLYKLFEGKLLETAEEIKIAKNEIISL